MHDRSVLTGGEMSFPAFSICLLDLSGRGFRGERTEFIVRATHQKNNESRE